MSFWDKVKRIITVPEDGQFYEDQNEPDNDLPPLYTSRTADDNERRDTSRSSGRTNRRTNAQDDAGAAFGAASSQTGDKNAAYASGKVVDIHTTAKLQVVLRNPDQLDEAQDIANELKNRRTVVLNLEKCNREAGRRIIDFLTGVAYANGGQLKKIAQNTFIITPYNVDVSGDLLGEIESNGYFFN